MRRLERGRYAVHLYVLAEPPYETGEAGDDDGAWITEAYAHKLEAEIRASPANWLWVHNKWKYAKPPEERSAQEEAVATDNRAPYR